MKCYLVFLLLFLISELKGQSDFRAGYIITNNNDTIHGLIDYRGDVRNSKRCDFKKNEASDVKEFLPADIKGFRYIDSKYYISKNVVIDSVKMQVFLEFLVNGIADLFYLKGGDNKSHYFIEKSDGQLFELTNEEKIIEKKDGNYYSETKRYIGESKRYIGLLKYAFADCPQLFQTIDHSLLETKPLVDITKKYHNYVCDNEKCIIYEKQLPSVRVKFSPFVSINASFLSFENTDLIYKQIQFQMANYPSIGLQMNTSLPRANEKLSFQASGEFGKSYFYGNLNYSGDYIFQEAHLHVTSFKGKAGFKYSYPKGKLRPTLMFGGNLIKLIKSDIRRIEERKLGSSTIETTEFNDDILPDSQYGYSLDLGFNYKSSSSIFPFVSLGYTYSSGKDRYPKTPVYKSLTTIIKTININAGLYF